MITFKFFRRGVAMMVMVFLSILTIAQEQVYNYAVDLTEVVDDQLVVSLQTPAIDQQSIKFFMPKIIPGTYRETNFGRFVSDLKAFDKKGKELPVSRNDDNSWSIEKADRLRKITYKVEDIFDTEKENQIYRMSATNIEEGKNFVISTPGFFGYLEGMKEIPFLVTINKPEGFYGSTGLKPITSTAQTDKFMTADYDELVDSPLMYNVPDTTFINIGGTRVLVSVYAPKGLVKSAFFAKKFEELLKAEAKYLGGNLPVDKYAFIMYFADPENVSPYQGALEHNISSFYYLPEVPQENLAPFVVDIAAHEFFHIITPLSIHSEEIANFDFNEPDLSKHLWLYEGVTEYASDHVQVKYNLIPESQYLNKLAEKITLSANYNDKLPFTELSEKAAGEHQSQYANVYEKGALIAAMLDIRLNELSKGKMNLMDLMNQLSKKYGPTKPFEDDELFDVITALTYPEIGDFFNKYVGGTHPLPIIEYFQKVGVNSMTEPAKSKATLGYVQIAYNQEEERLMIAGTSQMNEFGKKMGFNDGDLIYSIQGKDVLPQLAQGILQEFSDSTKEGEIVEVVIGRKNNKGVYEKLTLSAPAVTLTVPGKTVLSLNNEASYSQLKLRNQWLMENPVTANPKDVESIDALLSGFYDVISGPAGDRDWERFHAFFTNNANMSAMVMDPQGQPIYYSMTPEKYEENNATHFRSQGFWEKEIGREVFQYGNMASVISAYEYSTTEGGAPLQRGINTLQLVYEKGRWWVANIVWNPETPENPIPERILDKK